MHPSRGLRTVTLLAAVLLAPSAAAAPPPLTTLFPAGARRGTSVEVTAGGASHWPVRGWASGKGVAIRAAKEKGKLLVSVAADAVPGIYWIRLHDDQGASPLRPFLVGTLPERTEQEPNDEPAQAQAVELPTVVNGRLAKSGDVDCFAVKLKKGQTLVAALEANRTLESPMDAALQVLSADGFVLGQDNDTHGLDPQLVFAVPKDGTYLVRAFAFPAAPDAGIGLAGSADYIYRLTLTTGGFADHAVPAAVSRSAPGKVELVGWNIPEKALSLPVPTDASAEAVALIHAGVANAVRVRLEPHSCWDATRPSAKRPQTLSPPFTVTGRLDRAGVADVFSFAARKGQRLRVQIAAPSGVLR